MSPEFPKGHIHAHVVSRITFHYHSMDTTIDYNSCVYYCQKLNNFIKRSLSLMCLKSVGWSLNGFILPGQQTYKQQEITTRWLGRLSITLCDLWSSRQPQWSFVTDHAKHNLVGTN